MYLKNRHTNKFITIFQKLYQYVIIYQYFQYIQIQ
jgi:hypothetical protein